MVEEALGWMVWAAIGVGVAAPLWQRTADRVRRRRARTAFGRLLERGQLDAAPLPLGKADLHWASFRALPVGHTSHHSRWAVTRTITVTIESEEHELRVAAFEWHWDDMGQRHEERARKVRWRRTVAAIVELPVPSPSRVSIVPLGPTDTMMGAIVGPHGGFEVESHEFNRAFTVEFRDDTLAMKLLDAGMQHRLVTSLQGQRVELDENWLLVVGRPSHRDDSLYGPVGDLPAVIEDARAVAQAIPDAFWRAARRQRERLLRGGR